MLNVRRFPPPSSRIYHLHYIGAETREEGGTRCQRALAAEADRGAEEIGQQEVAETASGCPKRWCWRKRRTAGTEDSPPFAWRPKPAAIRHVWGGAGNGGLAAGCPRPEEPPPSARRRRSIGPSTKDVQYHRMAPRVNHSAG